MISVVLLHSSPKFADLGVLLHALTSSPDLNKVGVTLAMWFRHDRAMLLKIVAVALALPLLLYGPRLAAMFDNS